MKYMIKARKRKEKIKTQKKREQQKKWDYQKSIFESIIYSATVNK